MQIQKNNNLIFTGKKEVLYNLAKALDNAKSYAPTKMSTKDPILLDNHYIGRLKGYLDAAVNDDEFFKIIQDSSTSLNTPTKAQVNIAARRDEDGSIKWCDYTLAQIVNLTGAEGNGIANKTNAFKIFADELRNIVMPKTLLDDAKLESVKRFINELKSKITHSSEDNYSFENVNEKFDEIIANSRRFD